MAKVICCWTHEIHRNTYKALTKHVKQVQLFKLDVHDRFAYRNKLIEQWHQGEDLIILEPDMGVTEETVPSLERCSRDWCTWGYIVPWYPDTNVPNNSGFIRTIHSLGATKISDRARSRLMAIDWVIDTLECEENCGGGWWHLDKHIARCLMRRGYRPHDHGDIAHFHDYSAPSLAPLKIEAHHGNREELIAILKGRGWNHPERMSVFNEAAGELGAVPEPPCPIPSDPL